MSKNTDVMLNEDIDFPEVRCIGDDGEQYGLISSSEALKIAEEKGVDLVLIAPDAKPPVCKVMDYGKFRYQQEKKLKEAKKKQKQIEIKEIKLSVKIAINDINYKVKHAKEFLSENKHVRFRVFLRGREVSEPQVGFEVLNKVASMLEEVANVDKDYKIEGRYVNMLVTPKK
ncbi:MULTISPECIES: translation initiation factor IF-3 [Helicobacter]|uniref:Translation initiation factor IF-3 n=1 Tax=Helicobacter ibis TaxID=2962633 RepID=A0ABT4VCF3_9HELI|nr:MULTISPECIES: translation initiation factor IF-3 [Helicobacter]MDA3967631.1 translation initiation factor IF-3 [Helicobacter sp. WB40]MDA3968385.1 translation initiation factor IF-3 [Helicobacter ibis]